MKVSPIARFAIAGGALALVLTVLRYAVGGWYDDMPNTFAALGSAGVVGAAAGAYVALLTRKYGRLRAVTRPR